MRLFNRCWRHLRFYIFHLLFFVFAFFMTVNTFVRISFVIIHLKWGSGFVIVDRSGRFLLLFVADKRLRQARIFHDPHAQFPLHYEAVRVRLGVLSTFCDATARRGHGR